MSDLTQLRFELHAHVEAVQTFLVRTRQGILEGARDIGLALIAAKADCRHGEWLPFLAVAGIDDRTARRWMQYGEMTKSDLMSDLPSITKLLAPATPHVSQATGDPEWYTPPWVVDAAREVLGRRIDIDPASSEAAQETVKADRWLSAEQDALNPETEWLPEGTRGTCWVNPPYDAQRIAAFAARLQAELASEAIGRALWLSNNAADTRWARDLLQCCSCFALLHGRVKFYKPGQDKAAPLQGQMLIGFNVAPEALRDALDADVATVSVPVLGNAPSTA